MSKRRKDKVCPVTGKVRFTTPERAAEAVLNAKIAFGLRGNRKRKECRFYPCTACGGFHLTSHPRREVAA